MQVGLVFAASPSAARMSYSIASVCLHVHVVFRALLTAAGLATIVTLAITYYFSVIVPHRLLQFLGS